MKFFVLMSNTLSDVLNYAQLAAISSGATISFIDDLKLNSKIFNDIETATHNFRKMFKGFDYFVDRLPPNVMVGGSTCLAAFSKAHKFRPNDIDLYINDCKPTTVRRVDSLIRDIYHGHDIVLIRSPYILSWTIVDSTTEKVVVNYQLILSPAPHWSHVFAGYHSDLVCLGYNGGRFLYAKGRWDVFARTNKSVFFADLVSPRFQPRVSDACEKYKGRGFDVSFQERTMDLGMKDIERSDPIHVKFEGGSVKLAKCIIDNKYGIFKVGEELHEVYFGEEFKPIIESMSCFTACPRCGVYVFSKSFCSACQDMENNIYKEAQKIIYEHNDSINALVTGGRCGLGAGIKEFLTGCGAKVSYTTRFPKSADAIKLDLIKPDTWSNCQEILEGGDVNLLILSAAETLHYDSPPESSTSLDWTGDFERPNTGVWHKTLEEHSLGELTDPLLINVAGCAALLGSFLKGAKKRIRKNYCAIVVTSYEGRFSTKSPFHPITNASKAAIEQVVWTIKRQVDAIGDYIKVVLADPGWMYTESSLGKIKGPVSIELGAVQVLTPFIVSLVNPTQVENATIWNRYITSPTDKPEEETSTVATNVTVLEPCGHVVKHKMECRYCPECGVKVAVLPRTKFNVMVSKHDNMCRLEHISPCAKITPRAARPPIEEECDDFIGFWKYMRQT